MRGKYFFASGKFVNSSGRISGYFSGVWDLPSFLSKGDQPTPKQNYDKVCKLIASQRKGGEMVIIEQFNEIKS
jgi:hypothetical protein